MLGRGFYAFGHHVHLEGVRERNDCRNDRAAFLAVRVQAVGEEAVDLQLFDAEALQVGETRIAGTEIIDRNLEAAGLERADHLDRAGRVLHCHGLGNLEHDPVAWNLFRPDAAAAEFIELNREAREQLTDNTTEWLHKQASNLKGNLERSNTRLQDFARRNGPIFAGSQSTLAQDRVRELQIALARAESDRATKQARYEAAVTGSADLTSERSTSGRFVNTRRTLTEVMRRQLAG